MRRHDARKWLHAILDLLPVILIPVFMIYSHRHAVADGTPVADVSSEIEYQYQYQTNEVNSLNDLQINKVYYTDALWFQPFEDTAEFELEIIKGAFDYIDFSSLGIDETYLSEYSSTYGNRILLHYLGDSGTGYLDLSFSNGEAYTAYVNYELNYDDGYTIYDCYFYITNNSSLNSYKYYSYELNLDLPTASDYLGQIVSATADVDVDISYADSSVMNVFVDQFNETVNTYFNMGNVFGMNGVYEWFNTNIFGGNAPTIIYSVWNIALYELLMDLLMLLYALFMWFIDFCQDLIDRCFTTSKGGKH